MSDSTHAEDIEGQQSSTARFFSAARERWWVILVSGLVCSLAAFAYATTQPNVYQGSSTLLFRNVGFDQALFGTSAFTPSLDPTRDASTNIALITSREVATQVRRNLNLDMSVDELLGMVSVQQNENSDLISVVVNDPDPKQAADIATQFATQFVTARQAADRAKVKDAESLIRNRLAEIPADAPPDERNQLTSALQKLVALEAIQTGNAEVVDKASVPSTPVAPTPKRNAELGLILGLALGCAIALALDHLDRRIRTAEGFEHDYGLPLLARIPHNAIENYSPNRMSAKAFEPYRMLRTALGSISASGRPVRTLLITSAMPDEGKTLVSVNLARAMALTGEDAVLVEADVRDPDFGKHFDLEPGAAELTSTLTHGTSEDDLQRVSPGSWSHAGDLPSGDIVLLPSGATPANAAELLSGTAMTELLDWLGDVGDVVIVDAPPLLPVADTHSLLDQMQIDACIIVGRANTTTREQVQRARAILDQHRVSRVIGVVVTDTAETEGSYGYYGSDEVLENDGPGPSKRNGKAPKRAKSDAPADDAPAQTPPPAAPMTPPAPPQQAPPQAAPPMAPPTAPPPYAQPAPYRAPQAPPPSPPQGYAPPPAPVAYPAPAGGYSYPPPRTNGANGVAGGTEYRVVPTGRP